MRNIRLIVPTSIATFAIILAGAGCSLTPPPPSTQDTNSPSDAMMKNNDTSTDAMRGSDATTKDDAMMQKDAPNTIVEDQRNDTMNASDAMGKDSPGAGENTMMQKDAPDAMTGEGELMDASEKTSAMKPSGTYTDYSEQTLAAATQQGQKVVLFFHAAWCPFCKAADAAFIKNAGEIPSNVTLLKVDYDTQITLKQRYGVNYQHTFVQIDAQGNPITKWVSGDIALLKQNVI